MSGYDVHRIPLETRIDMLNHFPCFPVVDRVSRETNDFYHYTIDEMRKLGYVISIPRNCDRYKEELSGIEFLTAPDFKSPTVWNRYGKILNILQTIVSKNDETVRNAVTALTAVLNAQSVTQDDIIRIMGTLNGVAKSLSPEEKKDAFRELMDCVYMDLLPYKLHGYGITLTLDEINAELANAGVSEIERGYDQKYLELLINLFMSSLQGLRGKSLDDTKHRLKTIAVIIYLFITGLVKKNWTGNDLFMFSSYIDKMLNYGVGDHVNNLVLEMLDNPATYFGIVNHLNEKDNFLNYAIKNRTRHVNDEISKDTISNKALDHAWNQMLLVGNGYFNAGDLSADRIDQICYDALQITPELVSNYLNVEPSSVVFKIPENNLGYLRRDSGCDLCKIYRRLVRGGTPESITLMYVPAEDDIFALFNTANSKDTYGISIHNGDDDMRKILKVGADNSKYNYSLVLGGDLE